LGRRGRGRAASRIHSIPVIDLQAMSGAWRGMPPIGATASANAYKPRCADEELVYRVVAAELDGFLAETEARGHPLPSFVESTFRDFLTCGIPEHGFLRVHCDGCGRDRVVPFSCKRRGVCNSCAGRRMAETAAHLVDGVLPAVPTRQWVLSLPFPLRYRLAYDRNLATPLLAAFLRAVFASLRRRARECHGVRKSKCGAITFLQRFGGALNLNVHFHSLVLDGVYEVLPESRGVRFLELPPPDPHEVLRVLADTVERLLSALRRGGYGSEVDADGEDELSRDNPVMAALYAAAVQGRIAMGADAGQRITRLGSAALAVDAVDAGSARAATLGGFSLHAGVAIGANDRAGLERVCRLCGGRLWRPNASSGSATGASSIGFGTAGATARQRWCSSRASFLRGLPRRFRRRGHIRLGTMVCSGRAPHGAPTWSRRPMTGKGVPARPLVPTIGHKRLVRGATCSAACSRWTLCAAIDADRRCG